MKPIYLTCILFLLVRPILAQSVEIPKDPKRIPPVISTDDIVKRYKVGDKWQSLSVFRINGKGSSTDWGIKGDVEFMQSNRYHTQVSVLESERFGETLTLTLQCDVLDASSSKVFTKKKLRLVGFDSNDVLFIYAFNEAVNAAGKIYPPLKFAITLAEKLKIIDPEYERSLTTVANRLGLEPDQLISAKELEWFEEPRVYSGCSFKLKWVKEFGVVKAEQINDSNEKTPKLSVEDVRKWAVGADPLAELYIDPSLQKKVGDSWTLDAAQATPLFAGQGGARSTGKINVRYESDGTYAGSAVRNVLIQNGNIEVTLDDDNTATRYQLNSMEGNIKLDIPLRWATVASYGTFTRFADIALRPVIKQSQSDEHEIEFGYAELRHLALLRLIILAVAFHVLVVVFFGGIAPHSILRRIKLRIARKGAA